jgi:hypothetical protein
MTTGNKEFTATTKGFTTQDIVFAAYLIYKGVQLKKIEPIDRNYSVFIFDEIPGDIAIEYCSGVKELQLVKIFRHLQRDSREIWFNGKNNGSKHDIEKGGDL